MVTFLFECQQSRSPKMAEPWLHRMQGIIRYRALKNASEPNTTHRGCDLSAGFGFDCIQFKTEISLNCIVLALSMTWVFSLELWISKYNFKVYFEFLHKLRLPHSCRNISITTNIFSSHKALFKTKSNIDWVKLCKKNWKYSLILIVSVYKMLAMKFVWMQSFNFKKAISSIVISITKLKTQYIMWDVVEVTQDKFSYYLKYI